MDDLLQEFLTESHEHLDTVDRQIVEFERNPSNGDILRNIFRLVHTIKGTCGFLGLPRLEALTHSAETLLGQLRDGAPVTPEAVTLTLASIDRVKQILGALENTGAEPDGDDQDLISGLDAISAGAAALSISAAAAPAPAEGSVGSLTYQVLERPLKPGEASLDELEAAFRNTAGPQIQALEAQTSDPAHKAGAALLDETAESRVAAQSIRVNVGTLEHLMTMVSELVLTRNQLLDIARRQQDGQFKAPLQRLSHITAELQDGVMKTRMQPIGNAWSKLPRIVRDLSNELGKKIELVMEGADTELDRQVLDQIKDPLTHMVRNSADHGVETPEQRRKAGKPDFGTIRLTASHDSGSITIRISDDGRGLDVARIRAKALDLGLVTVVEADKMTDAQIARFIFHPGFSTAAAVTSVSGRGVGMDVVKTNIDAIGGTVDIASEPGAGSTFTVKIPLTLAIISALIVSVGDQRFAIPQLAVRELVRVEPGGTHAVETINGASLLRLRERLLPVVSVSNVMDGAETGMSGFVVVTQVGQQQFGVMVDGVLHTEEIVVKPMSSKLRQIQLFSGNTILGDGAVVLILEPNGLARAIGSLGSDEETAAGSIEESAAETAAKETILVMKGGCGALKAVPLSLVTRLEEIDSASIEWSSGRALVQYRGRLMPIVPASSGLEIARSGMQPLVIFSEGSRTMGLAVEAIIDIIEDNLDIEVVDDRPGVLGTAVLGGRATEIIDLAHYLPQAYPDWLTARRAAAAAAAAHGPASVLLVEPSEFLRGLLAPVIRAAGFSPVVCASVTQAEEAAAGRGEFRAVVACVESIAADALPALTALAGAAPVFGLASAPHPDLIGAAHDAGIHTVFAKFDRQALITAIAAIDSDLREAA
jgi:two-component system, chemotaxis family, sensor kinase CheA